MRGYSWQSVFLNSAKAEYVDCPKQTEVVGIALGGTASALKVREICQAGETQACQKIPFTETGNFGGTLGGGSVGAWIGSGAAPAICAAIGMGSAGIGGVICGLVVAGGALAAGGTIGG